MKKDFVTFLLNKYPHLTEISSEAVLLNLVSENLLSPIKKITLPKEVLQQAQDFVTSVYQLRDSQDYQQQHQAELSVLGGQKVKNRAFAMSYDFHLNAENQLKLIEVNTNASFLALADELYDFYKLQRPVPLPRDFIYQTFLAEFHSMFPHRQLQSLAIIDEEPTQQKLFVEFLVYWALLRKNISVVEILDYRQSLEKFDLVYNRTTDFYFKAPEYKALKEIWQQGLAVVTPQPIEYALLADKQRMIDWAQKSEDPFIQRYVPKCQDLNIHTAEEIWSTKKTWFIKPKRSFGSKQSYRGASISRKLFDELIAQDMIAQEYIPASEVSVSLPEGAQSFKYDLRFYAYKGQIQSVIARLYQGQVTNLKTYGGGFACVEFD